MISSSWIGIVPLCQLPTSPSLWSKRPMDYASALMSASSVHNKSSVVMLFSEQEGNEEDPPQICRTKRVL